MTRTKFRKRTKSLKKDMLLIIDQGIEKVIQNNLVDFDKYEDNYLLPKIFMSAIGAEIERQFRPLSKESKKDCDNLKIKL